MPASLSTATFTPDGLVVGPMPILTERVTLAAGQNLARGAVVGKITASGKYILSLSGAVDGSQVPDAIVAEPADATAADVQMLIYVRGDFDQSLLILGAAHTVASIKDGLRDKNIYLIKTQER